MKKRENEKGILTKELEKKFGKRVDEWIHAGFLEGVDGFIFTQAIRGLDNHFGEKIHEPYKTKLKNELTIIFEEEDYEVAVNEAFKFLDEMIDIPGIDDEMEAFIFKGLAQVVIGVLLNKNIEPEK